LSGGGVLPTDPPAYDAASVEVMDTLRQFPVIVEVWGWDEAFLGAETYDPAELGLETVAQLAAADPATLKERFGPRMGGWYHGLGQGLGDTRVTDVPREPVSRSREITFATDLTDQTEIEEQLVKIATEVTRDVVAEGRRIQRVAVKVRYASFYTPIKSRKLPEISQDPDEVARATLVVLAKFDLDRPVRLLGVRVEFAPPEDRTESAPDEAENSGS
jgi:nucleotidyltransferase/DNA polymerase involved in DNA repair